MKQIKVYLINSTNPLIYNYKDHQSLTLNLKENCLVISEVKGILLILPISQLRKVKCT